METKKDRKWNIITLQMQNIYFIITDIELIDSVIEMFRFVIFG